MFFKILNRFRENGGRFLNHSTVLCEPNNFRALKIANSCQQTFQNNLKLAVNHPIEHFFRSERFHTKKVRTKRLDIPNIDRPLI